MNAALPNASGGFRPQRRVRQSDIAREAGVSQTVVSLVLAGKDRERGITEDTRAQVLEVANTLGYRPNTAARRLRGMNNRLIGVQSYGDIFPILHKSYNYAYLVGAHLGAERAGYDVVLFTSTRRNVPPSPFLEDEDNRLGIAEGAVIVGGRAEADHLRRLSDEHYPVVHIGRRAVDGLDIPWVGSDLVNGTAQLVDELVAQGHRRLVYLGGDQPTEERADRITGFRAATTALGMRAEIHELHIEQMTTEWLSQVMRGGGCTIIVEQQPYAMRVVNAATLLGLRLRSDIAIAVLQSPSVVDMDSWFCGFLLEQREEIGFRATQMLVTMIEGRPLEEVHQLVPCLPQVTTYGFTPG